MTRESLLRTAIGILLAVILFGVGWFIWVNVYATDAKAETCVEKCYRIHGTGPRGNLCAANCP